MWKFYTYFIHEMCVGKSRFQGKEIDMTEKQNSHDVNQSKLSPLSKSKSELERELRILKRREKARAAAKQKAADRKEADALLVKMRSFGIPVGMSVEFMDALNTYQQEDSEELFSNVLRELERRDKSDDVLACVSL